MILEMSVRQELFGEPLILILDRVLIIFLQVGAGAHLSANWTMTVILFGLTILAGLDGMKGYQ